MQSSVVACTLTYALTNVTFRYGLEIANKGYLRAIRENHVLNKGINVVNAN
ncbi:MAG: hypothetical protein ACYDEJ_00420 [Desulfitobacteriaceae bacterium]